MIANVYEASMSWSGNITWWPGYIGVVTNQHSADGILSTKNLMPMLATNLDQHYVPLTDETTFRDGRLAASTARYVNAGERA
jgi:hypothetical protein